MNSPKAIFCYVALLLDEWFCPFWTLCWNNADLIVSMHAWQRPCFRKEGPQIHICIKPTEKREERSCPAGARWWTGFGALLVQPCWSNHPPHHPHTACAAKSPQLPFSSAMECSALHPFHTLQCLTFCLWGYQWLFGSVCKIKVIWSFFDWSCK